MSKLFDHECHLCNGRGTYGADRSPCICTIGTGEPRKPALVRTPARMRTLAPVQEWRPQTRADCADVPRPCPFVGCAFNTYLDIHGRDLHFRRPHLAPWDVPAAVSCVLDIADQGGLTLDEVGEIENITRERVRQIEAVALVKMGLRKKDLE